MIFSPDRLRVLFSSVAAVLVCLLLAWLAAVPAVAAKPSPTYQSPAKMSDGGPAPQPIATSWAVGDLTTGEVHSQHGLRTQHAPASVIKLLTALALIDVFPDHQQKVEALAEDPEIDGTKVGIMPGNSYTVDQLFHAMLMSSANDAAHALGRAAGGQQRAVQLMEDKAHEIGMRNTKITNTTGLDEGGQFTTVADLMVLAHAVVKNEYLMQVIGTQTYKFPGGKHPQTKKKVKGYEIQNHTKIVGQVPGGLGLKNGYTTTTKGSFVAVATRGQRTVVAAVLGSQNRTREAATDLLNWDFLQTTPPVVSQVAMTPPRSENNDKSASGGTAQPAQSGQGQSGQGQSGQEQGGQEGTLASRLGLTQATVNSALPWVLLVLGVGLLAGVLVGLLLRKR